MKRLLAIIAIVFVALFGIAWYGVFYTSYGVNALLPRLQQLQSMRLVIADVSGTLAGGLRVKRFELDHKYVHVVAEDIELELAPAAIFSQTLRVERLHIGRADVTAKQVDDTVPTEPPRFFTPFLLLQADAVDIRNARFARYDGFSQPARRVRGRARITAERMLLDRIVVEADQFSAAGFLALRARRPIALEADLAFRLPAAHAELQGKVAVSGDIERLSIDSTLHSPSAAQIDSEFIRSKASWQFQGSLAAPEFSFAPWMERPPFSLRQAALTFNVTPQSMQVQGSVTVPELDTAPLQIDATGRYADKVLAITHAAIRPSDTATAISGAGRVEFDGGRPQINATAQWQQLQWPLRAAADTAYFSSRDGQLSISGEWPYEIGAQADIVVHNDLPVHLSAHGRIAENELTTDNIELLLLNGRVTGEGRLQFEQRAWQMDVQARDIDPAPLYAPLSGSISFNAKAIGTGYDRHAQFALTMPMLSGTLRGEALSGRGEVTHGREGWLIKGVNLNLGAAHLDLSGKYADKIDLQWALDVPALEKIVSTARGSLATQGSLRGTYETPHIDATLRGERLAYADWQVESITARADTHLAGNDASQLDVAIRGLRSGRASLGSPHLHASMSAQRLPRYAFDKREEWRVDRFCIDWPENDGAADNAERQLCGDAQWARNGTWSLHAQSSDLSLAMFDDSFPKGARYGGYWQARLNLASSKTNPLTGEATVRVTDATLTHQPVEGEEEVMQLGSGQVSLLANPTAFIANARLTTPGTTTIDANARIERRTNTAWNESPLTGRLQAHTADANLLPLIIPDIDHSNGELTADLAVRGTVALPELSGRIELAHGELALYRYNLSLREMALVASFIDNRVDFDGRALAGEGQMRIQGQLAWRDLKPEGTLHFTGERLTIADLPEYKILASPDVRFAIKDTRLDIDGEVFIPTARLQPTDLSGATQLSPDARLTSAQPADKKRGFDIYMDVRVRIGDDVLIDTMGLQGKLGGTVATVVTPDERTIGRGELSVGDGRYEAYGQKLEISRGRLLFNSSPIDDPGLDIQAERKVEAQRVGINVRGTLRAPRISLFSDPSLTQAQTVSYLLTGKPLDDLKSGDASQVGVARDNLALQGGGVLASQIGRRIGLEEVGIESNGTKDTSLVLGKFLSPRLFVSYGISLTESINTLKLRYTLSDRWLFKSEVGQNQSADLEFRIEH